MTAAVQLIEEGRGLLARERELFLAGRLTEVAPLTEAKQEFIARLDAALGTLAPTPLLSEAVAALAAEARRNEQLIAAAREGVAAARRKIGALAETRRGAVAYDRKGARITSRADAAEKTKTA